MNSSVFSISIGELAERTAKSVPSELQTAKHLIYSSPATLSYNSPGAQGFGVKRAGLVIPESVELVISPVCCARNSTVEGGEAGFSDRMFFLRMDETDLVTGRHLTKISQAVGEIVDFYEPRPKVVVLCVTCADALLGTDMERVCRRAEEENEGIRVVPSYMYALTRESIKPPMVAVRKTVYSLLEPVKTRRDVNLLGYFSPLQDDCEIRPLLRKLGYENVNEISRCRSLDEYHQLAAADINLVLYPEANFAAEDLRRRLGTPYAELKRLYQADKINRQYVLLAAALGQKLDTSEFYEAAKERVQHFKEKFAGRSLSIGQTLNADPFELALAFARYGFEIKKIFSNFTEAEFPFVRQLAQISPETRLFVPANPTMLNYEPDGTADITIGRDAVYYEPEAVNVPWNREIQPFGFAGLVSLLDEIDLAVERRMKR